MAKKIATIIVLALALCAILWGMRQLMKPHVASGDDTADTFITSLKK